MAKDMTDLVLDYLPDRNGRIRAEYSNTAEAQMIGNLEDRGSRVRNKKLGFTSLFSVFCLLTSVFCLLKEVTLIFSMQPKGTECVLTKLNDLIYRGNT